MRYIECAGKSDTLEAITLLIGISHLPGVTKAGMRHLDGAIAYLWSRP